MRIPDAGDRWRFPPQNKDEIGKIAGAYIKEAREMAAVAAAGDAAAVKAQFGKLGESCKACHDKFRKEEKK